MKNHKVIFAPHPPIILKEIGDGREREAISTIKGMDSLAREIAKEKPNTIIFISPHGNAFSNGTCILYEPDLSGSFKDFGYGGIRFSKNVNQELSEKIYNELEALDFTSVLMDKKTASHYRVNIGLDHGVMVPMYFIDQYYCDYDIVHITPGFTGLEENYHIGKLIQNVIHKSNSKILILCSGDLSHALSDKGPYSYHRNGKIFDDHIKMSIESKDVLKLLYLDHRIIEEASQCGLRSFLIGFGSMDGYYYESEVLSYEGPFGVGYLTGFLNKSEEENSSLLFALQKNKEKIYFNKIQQEDEYILLARKSIETYIKTGKKISLDYVGKHFSKDFIDKCMQHHLGAFVSIHKNHMLRGCMGTISAATDHLLDEIIYNSISACSNDPRFDRVREEELVELDIKVDLLYEKEEIFSKDDLDTMKYGVIVEKDSKRGLLLPNLEGIDSVEEQIKIAMEKAGIKNKEGMLLYRFEVERHEVQ